MDRLRTERVILITREVGRSKSDLQTVMVIQVGNYPDIDCVIDDAREVLESYGEDN